MATLEASSRDFQDGSVLSYTFTVDKFIESIFRAKTQQSVQAAANRLIIKHGRYLYTPSNEYTQEKSIFIRAKFGR